jgi:zinc finger/BTB domain-containing protein 5
LVTIRKRGGKKKKEGLHIENPFSEPVDSHFVRLMQEVMGLPVCRPQATKENNSGWIFPGLA